MSIWAKITLCVFALFANLSTANAQSAEEVSSVELILPLKRLANKAIEANEAQRNLTPVKTDIQKLDHAITEYDSNEILGILANLDSNIEFKEVYKFTVEVFEGGDKNKTASALDWLENCAENTPVKKAHKCTISLGFLALLDDEIGSTLDWSLKSLDLAKNFSDSDTDYWYAQYQSSELMLIAFILDGNIQGALNAGNNYVDSALKSKVEFGAYNFVNNLSYLARTEINPEAALEILKEVLPSIETLAQSEQEIMYYALGKNYTYVEQYQTAIEYYNLLENVVERPDVKRAYLANAAYVNSKLGNLSKAKENADEARQLFENNLESEFGINILKAEKNIAQQTGDLSEALSVDARLDQLVKRLNEEALSANRNKLSKSLQVQNEKNERERDKLKFDAELSFQQATARKNQLMISFIALCFLMGLVAYMFRSYRREQKLNAEISGKNDELEGVNADLSEAHDNLSNTFQRLKVAHRQAMAGQDAKQKFIGVVGHELRTPLNPIINLSSVLEEKAENPREKALLKAIRDAGKRLHIIVENMLAISSSDEDSRVYIEKVDVVYETRTTVEEFSAAMRDRNKELRKSGEALRVQVYKHPALKVEQISNKIIYRSIVRNLFDNAFKFTPSGEIDVRLNPDHNSSGFVLEISDTGPGIPLEKIESFMKPFEQAEMGLGRSYEGAGLGLAVVQKYCEQLGAKMRIQSQVGEGTKISVSFPEPAHEGDTGKLLKVA